MKIPSGKTVLHKIWTKVNFKVKEKREGNDL